MRFLRPAAFVLGLLLLGYTVSGLFRSRALLLGTSEMDGTVVALTPLPGSAGDAPTIRYAPVPGAVSDWTTRTPLSGSKVGQHVTLLVRGDTGQVLEVGSFWTLFGPLAVTGLCGLVLLVLGASTARRFSRGERPWR
ncbi:MAG TPA: hypothetical protein VHS58_08470 [Acetobacteraceae bacterium]|jgi:hypothetical protein|nr:hypothetical protein [Acetobacteraceae bacterium]